MKEKEKNNDTRNEEHKDKVEEEKECGKNMKNKNSELCGSEPVIIR